MGKKQLCWAIASGFDLDLLLPELEKEINIKIGEGWAVRWKRYIMAYINSGRSCTESCLLLEKEKFLWVRPFILLQFLLLLFYFVVFFFSLQYSEKRLFRLFNSTLL